jgi:hypothetical protein
VWSHAEHAEDAEKSDSAVILSGSIVILSAAKDLQVLFNGELQILRCAQDNNVVVVLRALRVLRVRRSCRAPSAYLLGVRASER